MTDHKYNDAYYAAESQRMIKSFRNKPENVAAAKQAHAEGMPDVGVWAIASGLMTKDEVEQKFADIMNSGSPGTEGMSLPGMGGK